MVTHLFGNPCDMADIMALAHERNLPVIEDCSQSFQARFDDRLVGDAIPLEACVVGLADAWDAMTTDRPYRAAMSAEEAAAEVRRCRGTQFSPAVVDAFFTAFRRQPAVFQPDEPALDVAASA